MNPVVIIWMVVATVLFSGGFFMGENRAEGRQAKKDTAAMTALQHKYEETFNENNRIAGELEKAKETREVIYRDITKNVIRYIDRPVYHGACLDADGLRDVNAALSGKTAAAGQPANSVPRPDAHGGNHR